MRNFLFIIFLVFFILNTPGSQAADDDFPQLFGTSKTVVKQLPASDEIPISSDTKESPPKFLKTEESSEPLEEHFFKLTINSPECYSLLDSRGVVLDLKISNYDFTAWHEAAIKKLKILTPQVRRALSQKGATSHKNLLQYSASLILEKEVPPIFVEVEASDDVWISGWPGDCNRKTLASSFPNITFKFFDDFFSPEEKDLPQSRKASLLHSDICGKYALEKHGYLIIERLDYLKKSVERAKVDVAHFSQQFLHTEQALTKYFSSKDFKTKVINTINSNFDSEPNGITLLINISSYKSVCLHCADRLFRESEWGFGFAKDIRDQSGIDLKVCFFASACESHIDDLGKTDHSINLRTRLKKDPSAKDKIGFDGNSKINFMSSTKNRQTYSPTYPYVAHFIKQ